MSTIMPNKGCNWSHKPKCYNSGIFRAGKEIFRLGFHANQRE